MCKKRMVRIISIGKLNVLPRLHIRPIDLVVFQVPSWSEDQRRSYLGNSLALRCFQRLSSPCLATRRCSCAEQPEHQRHVIPGPLVLRNEPLKSPTPTADRGPNCLTTF